MNKQDIVSEKDIETMVRTQYRLLLEDKDTASKFVHLDLEHHLPKIFGFWKMVILAEPMAYSGNAFQPHIKLGLQKVHFDKWVQFLEQSIDENFEGPNALKAKNHAKLMSAIFKPKLGISES
jgi:hemoglobin